MSEIQELLDRLHRASFPSYGKRAGNFPLYDSLLAGCAERAAQGELVLPSEIPVPDEATSRCVTDLRQKRHISNDERAFVEYFDLLEQIREVLLREDAR